MREQMRKLVAHMEWADARVLGALRQAPSLRPVALELFGHALAVENAAGFRRVVDALTEADLDVEIPYVNSAGDAFRSTRADIMLQVMLHGSYHRGQVAAVLRAGGATPAPTDYIAFARGAPAATTRTAR